MRNSRRIACSIIAILTLFCLIINKTTLEKVITVAFEMPSSVRPTIVVEDLRNGGGNVERKIILVTLFRSGSSFFGELFRQNSQAHYVYEPFRFLSLAEMADENNEYIKEMQANIGQLSEDLLNCHYFNLMNASLTTFPKTSGRERLKILLTTFGRNLDDSINKGVATNLNIVDSIETQCRRHTVRVVKAIRLHDITQLKPLMLEKEVRVLLLSRDPRAIALSRLNLFASRSGGPRVEFSEALPDLKEKYLSFVKKACAQLHGFMNGMKAMSPFTKHLRDHFVVLRYEDLALQPNLIASKVYRFIDMEFPDEVKSWLDVNTKSHDDKSNSNLFATSRDSAHTVHQWRHVVSYDLADKVQEIPMCLQVFDFFGYGIVRSNNHLKNVTSDSLLRRPNRELHYIMD